MKRQNVETSKRRNSGWLKPAARSPKPDGATLITCDGVCCCPQTAADDVPTIVRLAPDGKVKSINGDFFVDEESGRLVQEALEAHGAFIPIDYEHTTLGGSYAAPSGQAPAAGWIGRVWYEKGKGLMAEVGWTKKAHHYIIEKEYRYVSPVAVIRKSDRKLVGIHSAGLTNKPAIPGMDALVAKQQQPFVEMRTMAEEPGQGTGVTIDMLVGMLAQKLGIDLEGKTDPLAILQAILAAVPEKGGGGSEGGDKTDEAVASKAILKALDVPEGADESAVVVAINTLKKADDGTAEMRKKLNAIEAERAKEKVDKVIDGFVLVNKINPLDKEDLEACRKLAETDPDLFIRMMNKRSAYAEPGKTTAPPGGGANNSRETIIANAVREYDEGEGADITDRVTWVSGALTESNMVPLTEDEKKTLAVA